MPEITEIFILKVKDPKRADVLREAARTDFLKIDGVDSWKTYMSTDKDRPTLYAEIYQFHDYEAAKRITPSFATREATKAYLEEVDEILVGQYFQEHTTDTSK